MAGNTIEYDLSISASYAQCEQLYMRDNNTVVVTTTTGVRVQLPTKNLRPFVGPNGIHGTFKLITSADNKILSLARID